jgi:predicted phage terminase large subunit-like protein
MAPAIDENALVADICRNSFHDFVTEFWECVSEETFVDNWHIRLLCQELQTLGDSIKARKPRPYDLLVNIAPGSTKSTIMSVMYPVWLWLEAPWVQIICGSYAQELSLDLSSKSRTIIQSAKFRACFPEIRLRADQNTKTYFQNTKGGWRYATSTGGAVTGKHAHVIIIDDPVDPQGALSEADMKAANSWLADVVAKRKVDLARTVSMMIMQRLAQNDPSSLWLGWSKRGTPLRHICVPARLTDDVKPRYLRRYYRGGLMDTTRLPDRVLQEQERINKFSYSGQYLQNPIPPGGGMFKVKNFKIVNMPVIDKGWRLVRYWDKAGTTDDGAYTVGVLMGRDSHGIFWVLDVVRGQWDAGEREKTIVRTTKLDGKRVKVFVEQEPGSSGKESVEATIRRLAGYRAYADRPTGDKAQRAEPYATQVDNHNVVLVRAEWNEEYLEELSFFPNSTYKDQVDASSGAFAHLAGARYRIGAF